MLFVGYGVSPKYKELPRKLRRMSPNKTILTSRGRILGLIPELCERQLRKLIECHKGILLQEKKERKNINYKISDVGHGVFPEIQGADSGTA